MGIKTDKQRIVASSHQDFKDADGKVVKKVIYAVYKEAVSPIKTGKVFITEARKDDDSELIIEQRDNKIYYKKGDDRHALEIKVVDADVFDKEMKQ